MCPNIDVPDCSTATYTGPTVRDMMAYIGREADTQAFITDSISEHYGSLDGTSFCSGNWEYTLDTKPLWLQEK